MFQETLEVFVFRGMDFCGAGPSKRATENFIREKSSTAMVLQNPWEADRQLKLARAVSEPGS